MRYRKLGNTGYDVSMLGFGTWQLSGERWSAPDRKQSVQLLRAARELGINVFDAAAVYGQYIDDRGCPQSRAQELLGEAFGDCREEVIYCIKLGQFDEYTHRADYTPHRVVAQLQQSLRRLKTDYIDICLIHAPSLHEVQNGQALAVLQTVQSLGIVRAVGYSFENEPEHVAAACRQKIDVLMLQYNLLDCDCKEGFKVARNRGIGVLVGGPFKRGYLTGRYRTVADLPLADDYWRWNVRKNPGKVAGLLQQAATLCGRHGGPADLRRAALQHVLAEPGAASAIVGHRSFAELQENSSHFAAVKGVSTDTPACPGLECARAIEITCIEEERAYASR